MPHEPNVDLLMHIKCCKAALHKLALGDNFSKTLISLLHCEDQYFVVQKRKYLSTDFSAFLSSKQGLHLYFLLETIFLQSLLYNMRLSLTGLMNDVLQSSLSLK